MRDVIALITRRGPTVTFVALAILTDPGNLEMKMMPMNAKVKELINYN